MAVGGGPAAITLTYLTGRGEYPQAMWPWEHVVVGYVTFSVLSRLLYGRPPGEWAALAAVFGSLLPDLVDKPLAWQFGVFETSYALAHSALVAVPVCAAVWLLARRSGRAPVGAGLTTGYLVHLPADVVPYYYLTGRWWPERILWPHRTAPPTTATEFGPHVFVYLEPYLEELLAGDPSTYLVVNLFLVWLALCLWCFDGLPGLSPFVDLAQNLGRRVGG